MKPKSRLGSVGLSTVALAAVLATSGCATSASQAGDGNLDTVRGVLSTDPATFDPVLATAADDFTGADLGYATLLKRSEEGVEGGLASDYVIEPDRIELTIKENQLCADGTPITASVVANSLERLADPEEGSTLRSLIFGSGETTVTADDASNKVVVEISEAYSDLQFGLTLPSSGIVCPAGLEDLDGLSAGTVPGAFSGPYTLTTATPGVEYEWTLREDFDAWAASSLALEGEVPQTIHLTPGATDSIANRLETSEIDFAGVAYEELERFDNDNFTIQNRYSGDYFVIFNQSESSPFTDPALRAAVAQAIDPEGFIQATNPLGNTTTSVGNETVMCYSDDASFLQPYDPTGASSVLDGVTINLIGSNIVGPGGAGVEYIAESLTAAGATVNLTNTDNSEWVSTLLSPETETWDMTLWASMNVSGTLVNSLGRVIGPGIEDGGRNIMRKDKPETSEPYNVAMTTTEPDAMCNAYLEAQQTALENVDFVPLGTNESAIASATGVDVNIIGGRLSYFNLRINQ